MRIIILTIGFLLATGCATTIKGSKCDLEGQYCVTFEMKTHNEYPEGYSANINTKTGDITVEVGAAVAKPNPLEQIGAEVINQAIGQLLPRREQ